MNFIESIRTLGVAFGRLLVLSKFLNTMLRARDVRSNVNSLQTFSFSHVCRNGNKVALALTRRAWLSSPLFVRMDSLPPDIHNVVVNDFGL